MNALGRDGAAVRVPPPLVYVAALIAGVLLQALAVPLPVRLSFASRSILAIGLVLLGLAMMASAIGAFKRTGQDPKPWKATPKIIVSGAYRFTRNPMYVSMALLQVGIGITLANGWVIALVPVVLLIVDATAIRPEEAYLERKFGRAYTDYKATVRRWL